MAIIIQYRYEVGELLTYQQSLSMIIESPGEAPVAGQATFECVHEVLKRHDDATWTLEVRQTLTATDGVLGQHVPDFLMEQIVLLRIDSDGTLLEAGDGPTSVRLPAYPRTPVDAGDSWTTTDSASGQPLEITYIVESIEDAGGETFVSLVSTGRHEDPAAGSVTAVEATNSFSVSEGYPVESTTVVETTWANGGTMQMVIENTLVERNRSSQSGGYRSSSV